MKKHTTRSLKEKVELITEWHRLIDEEGQGKYAAAESLGTDYQTLDRWRKHPDVEAYRQAQGLSEEECPALVEALNSANDKVERLDFRFVPGKAPGEMVKTNTTAQYPLNSDKGRLVVMYIEGEAPDVITAMEKLKHAWSK